MKVVVLDANAYWTEQLFQQCRRFADVLLLKPREFRAYQNLYGTIRSDRAPRVLADHVWEQRLSLPPGWMVELWPWAQRQFVRAIHAFAGNEELNLVITYPQYRGLFRTVRPHRSVYYNLDDYRDNWPRHRARVPRWEAETVEAADLTLCIADHRVKLLREQHPAKVRFIHHLPLGCTPEFMVASEDRGQKTEDAGLQTRSAFPGSADSGTARPTAGYIGALNYRFDFAFLADVAAQLPGVTFVLGGRVLEDGDAAWRAGLARAQTLGNIKFLGWVEHAKLGEHLRAFDVLLMPYARCNFNTNACPAKLWDYLGTGKPIIANTANPETMLWSEVVRIGATPETFAVAIQEVLNAEPASFPARRLEIAREHTWEKLSVRLEQILVANSTLSRR